MASISLFDTNNNTKDENKIKVFFSAHPKDIETFEGVVGLLRSKGYEVYTHKNMDLNDKNVNDCYFELTGNDYDLFVIPVTFDFLNDECVAYSYDYFFARNKHIPVMLLLEDRSIRDYAKTKLGNCPLVDFASFIEGYDIRQYIRDYLDEILLTSAERKKVKKSFESYAKRGLDRKTSSVNVGLAYIYGIGTKKDYEKGMAILERAKQNYNRMAYHRLAVIYHEGIGVEPNFKLAAELQADYVDDLLMEDYEYSDMYSIDQIEILTDYYHDAKMFKEEIKERDLLCSITKSSMIINKAILLSRMYKLALAYQANENDGKAMSLAREMYDLCQELNYEYDNDKRYIYNFFMLMKNDILNKFDMPVTNKECQKEECVDTFISSDLEEFEKRQTREKILEAEQNYRHPRGRDYFEGALVLAQTYILYRDNKALNFIKKIINETEDYYNSDHHPFLVEFRNLLAFAYIYNDDVQSALEQFKTVVEISTYLYGEYTKETLFHLTNYAICLNDNGDYQKAAEIFTKIYGMASFSLDKYKKELFDACCNLSYIERLHGSLDKSIEYAKEAYAIDVKVDLKYAVTSFDPLELLKEAYIAKGDLEKAKLIDDYYSRILAI